MKVNLAKMERVVTMGLVHTGAGVLKAMVATTVLGVNILTFLKYCQFNNFIRIYLTVS